MDFENIFLHATLFTVTENIQKNVDDKQIACGVFIDIEKTFDTVDHTLLLNNWITYLIMVLDVFQIGGSHVT